MSVGGKAFSAIAFWDDHAHKALLFKGVPQVLWQVSIYGDLIIVDTFAHVLNLSVDEIYVAWVIDRELLFE